GQDANPTGGKRLALSETHGSWQKVFSHAMDLFVVMDDFLMEKGRVGLNTIGILAQRIHQNSNRSGGSGALGYRRARRSWKLCVICIIAREVDVHRHRKTIALDLAVAYTSIRIRASRGVVVGIVAAEVNKQ